MKEEKDDKKEVCQKFPYPPKQARSGQGYSFQPAKTSSRIKSSLRLVCPCTWMERKERWGERGDYIGCAKEFWPMG
jgi:hypothetical protein